MSNKVGCQDVGSQGIHCIPNFRPRRRVKGGHVWDTATGGVCCHFTIWKDKINLKVDSDSLYVYLAPCKTAKILEICFSWSRSIFADFAAATNFRGFSYSWRFFTHFFAVQNSTSNIYYSKGIEDWDLFFRQNLLCPSNFILTKRC